MNKSEYRSMTRIAGNILFGIIVLMCVIFVHSTSACAAETKYNVWVGGTRVTSSNCNNKTWSYNHNTRTLTLNGYTISGKAAKIEYGDECYLSAVIAAKQSLTIVLKGNNKLTGKSIGQDSDEDLSAGIAVMNGNLVISGSGSLSVTGGTSAEGDSAGIYVYDGNYTQSAGTVGASGGKAYCSSYGLEQEMNEKFDLSVNVRGGTLKATGGTVTGDAEEAPISAGIYTDNMNITGGTVTAVGGSSKNGESVGGYVIISMSGGALNATGGSGKWSYGLRSGSDPEDDPECVDVLLIQGTATATVRGNTAAADAFFGYVLSEYRDKGFEEVGNCYVSSSYTPVVTVSSAANGTGSRQYAAPDPYLDLYTKYRYVSVRKAVLPTALTCSKSEMLFEKLGRSETLEVAYTPEKADVRSVTWTSEDEDVAEVWSDGMVVAAGPGETTITASCGKVETSCKVYVVPRITLDKIVLPKEMIWLHDKNETKRITAELSPSNAVNRNVKWSSSNNKIVEVNEDGVLTAVGEGTATIQAKAVDGEGEGTCSVTVCFSKDICDYEIKDLDPEYDFNGYSIRPDITISGLDEYEDYTCSYSDNVFPGTATVEICGAGRYSGTRVLHFQIGLDSSKAKMKGSCGKELNWCIVGGSLMISGRGAMRNYTSPDSINEAPWNDYTGFITNLWIGEGCTSVGSHAFDGLYDASIDKVSLADSITDIGESAFAGTFKKGFISIRFPEHLRTIGAGAFADNSGLYNAIMLPDSVTEIGESAFEKCRNIRTVSVGKGIRKVSDYAFAYCDCLDGVYLSDSVSSIGIYAFKNCLSLNSIQLPESISDLGRGSFSRCRALQEVRFDGNAPTTGSGLFSGCREDLVFLYKAGSTGWENTSWQSRNVYLWHDHDQKDVCYRCAGMMENGMQENRCSICGIIICSSPVSRIGSVRLSQTRFDYTGKAIQPVITVCDVNGKELKKGSDYEVKYLRNKVVGRAMAVVLFKGRYTGEVSREFTIAKKDISGLKVSLSSCSFVYSGKTIKPVVKVPGYGREDYQVAYSHQKAVAPGEYRVTVTGKRILTGRKVLTYRILPKGSSIISVKKKRNTLRVRWAVQKGKMGKTRITGYQIQYSTSPAFTGNCKTETRKGYKRSSVKLTMPGKGTKHYVRIRTYVSTGGKTVCSRWSKIKCVK